MPALVDLRGISKAYPGVRALDDVSLSITPGEVHALLGANGAGKSTLIKVLTGAVPRDAGTIHVAGRQVDVAGPQDAASAGIACLYQEPALVPGLTVEQNMFLGQEVSSVLGIVDRAAQRRRARAILEGIAPHLDPGEAVGALRTSERQMVALAKALLGRARLVIMDEPSASMTEAEIAALFAAVGRLRADGASVLYVTHRLDEVFRIADRITVLRDGRHVLTRPTAEITRDALIATIAGREVAPVRPSAPGAQGEVVLSVRRLSRRGFFADVSFDVRRGEIVGLAGLVGAGRSEIARAVLGADPTDTGEVVYPKNRPVHGPADALRAGVAMVPEDRKAQGLVPAMSVADNIVLSAAGRFAWPGTGAIRRDRVAAAVAANVARFGIEPPAAAGRRVETLSGGNQQKVVMARAVEAQADVLILDEPTAGVDVGAKSEIHRHIQAMAAEGKGVLLISSETEEMLALADRILVIREGRLIREIEGHSATSLTVVKSLLGADGERRPT